KTGKQESSLICNVTYFDPNLVISGGSVRPKAWFQAGGSMMAWDDVGTIRPWDLTIGREKPALGPDPWGTEWAGFSADGKLLRVAGSRSELGVWNAATGSLDRMSRWTDQGMFAAYYMFVSATDRGKVVITRRGNPMPSKSNPGQVFVWDPASR